VVAASPEDCKAKGGVYFATQLEAERYCKQNPPAGWCCVNGRVVAASPEDCKAKGGVYFATQLEAERYCRQGEKLPDLVIKNIARNSQCQVVVTVANAGPGAVPDEVWSVHTPTSSSVLLFINGRRWGGKTIWGFDADKSLQPAGGTARYVSQLIVGANAEITAVIDHTGEVSETNEGNNQLVKKLSCATGAPNRLKQ